MPTSPSFVQHALELLAGLGEVKSRAMFGGHGLSLNGISLGIIDDDRLYLRTDEATRPRFQAAGSTPFTYPGKKGPMVMQNYWALPDEAVDDADSALVWGRLAVEASVRVEASKKKPKVAAKKKQVAPSTHSAKKPAPAKAAPKRGSAKKPAQRPVAMKSTTRSTVKKPAKR